MYKHLFIIISLASLCSLLYGVLFLILEVEKNACRMTYMFEYPQFVRIHFKENNNFPKYALYAYSEGKLTENARALDFTGAPVIFVPGNSGSYKQARSFASVAIRKGLDNDWNHHLDYFTIDYNEEYSALFGGYLEDQTSFLKKSINTVLDLYQDQPNAPKQVVLVGHSMGGKIAQSLLIDPLISNQINTIISLASPLDKPVINFDFSFEAFYRKTHDHFLDHRSFIKATNDTNYCRSVHSGVLPKSDNQSLDLNDKLLISIGGGTRDILVHSGLTHSKFSDIHVLTSTIPNVWVSTDHLCSVWCLQLVFVVNRFLYSLIQSSKVKFGSKLGQSFIEDKELRLNKAAHYFLPPAPIIKSREINLISNEENMGEWFEDSRRVYSKEFPDGIKQLTFVMVRLHNAQQQQHKVLYTEAINVDSDDWVFGCNAVNVHDNMRYCSKGISLTNYVNKIPSLDQKRSIFFIDLHKLKKKFPSWSHVVFKLTPTMSKVRLNIDINDAIRSTAIKMPKWYSYRTFPILDDTLFGSSHYQLRITDMEESYQSLQINVKSRSCSKSTSHAVAKVSIPWARGSERFQHFTQSESNPLYVNAPLNKPRGINSTNSPIIVDLFLDPNCRYVLSYKNSFGGTMSRIFQQYIHWLPAHLTAILLLAFKYQISLTPKLLQFKCGKLHSALVLAMTLSIITASRIFVKIVSAFNMFPEPDNYHNSMLISIVIHGSSQALLLLTTAAVWMGICFNGNLFYKILLRLVKFNIKIPSFSALMPLFEKIPISAGIVLVSIAFAACGGVALLGGCAVYFMLLCKMYENYLEEFVFKTAKLIASKLFGRKVPEEKSTEKAEEEEEKQEVTVPSEENIRTEEDIVSTEVAKPPQSEEDEELERLLKEAITAQKVKMDEKQKKLVEERKEYRSIDIGLSSLNFHMTLFLLLCVLTVLNLPATISWAKNYHYQKNLTPDPSLIPAVMSIGSLALLWQFETPRNVYAYQFISTILYVLAAICIMYCQDSVYRLNAVISAVFVLVTAHQLYSPKTENVNDDIENCPDPVISDRIKKMEELLNDANRKPATPEVENIENQLKEDMEDTDKGEADTDEEDIDEEKIHSDTENKEESNC